MSTDYKGMRDMELYILRNKADFYKKELGVREYYRKLRELEDYEKPAASQNNTKASSTTQSDNSFYTNREDSGTIGTNKASANPYNVQNYAAPMNTPSNSSSGRSVDNSGYTNVGSSSGRYNNVGNVAAPMSTPSNSSRNVAGSGHTNAGSGANTSSDPYRIPWTDTQRMRNELDDLETQQNDLLVLNGGYMTTDILPQYRAYQDQIDQLNKKLAGADTSVQNYAAPMNTPSSGGRFATLGDAYVDFLEQEGVVFKDSAVNINATQPALGQSFTNDVVNSAGANGKEDEGNVNSGDTTGESLKELYTKAVTGRDQMAEILQQAGYHNIQELENAIQDEIGPLEYLTFKNGLEETQNIPNTGLNIADHENDYVVDEDYYGSKEAYLGGILERIATNPGHTNEILDANGYDSVEQLMTEMQGDMRPNTFLDLKGKLENMGYTMPKAGDDPHSAAYVAGEVEAPIVEDADAEREPLAEETGLLDAPLSELSIDELEMRKTIELDKLEDSIDQQMNDEIANIPKQREVIKQQYIDWYNTDEATHQSYVAIYGNVTAEEFAEAMLESWNEDMESQIREKYSQMYGDQKTRIEEEYEPYILAPVTRESLEALVFDIEYLQDHKIIEPSGDLKEELLQIIRDSSDIQNNSGKNGIDKVNIEFCETYSCSLSDLNGFILYDGIKEYQKNTGEAIESELIGQVPGLSQIVQAAKLENGPEFASNDDINNNLGGEYIVSTFIFTVPGDLNKGEIGQQYYTGTVIYKDDIVLDNGDIFEYPYNSAGCMSVTKKAYDYIKIAFQAEGTGGKNSW